MIQLDNCVKYFNRVILDELKSYGSVWVAGGCVRDYFSVGKLSSDIDLYFPTQSDFDGVKKYLVEQTYKQVIEKNDDKEIIKQLPKKKAKVIFENDNVIKLLYNGRQFDLVKKFFASASDCINEFDFTVCSAAVDIKQVYTHETFFIDLSKRQLMINKLPFPLSTMRRMQKYIQRGYYMCSGEMLKLSKAIGELQTNTAEGESANLDLSPMSGDDSPRFLTFD